MQTIAIHEAAEQDGPGDEDAELEARSGPASLVSVLTKLPAHAPWAGTSLVSLLVGSHGLPEAARALNYGQVPDSASVQECLRARSLNYTHGRSISRTSAKRKQLLGPCMSVRASESGTARAAACLPR